MYILASAKNGTLYIGVTSDLAKRIYAHKQGLVDGFSKRYAVTQLVYAAPCSTMEQAIKREKQMKRWKRQWKIELLEKTNPHWRDLYEELVL